MEASFRRPGDVLANLFGLRPSASNGSASDHAGPVVDLPRDWPERLPFRIRPKPYTRAVRWSPAHEETSAARRRPYELFIAQDVLREVRAHLIAARRGEPYGFLLGQVVYCPWTEAPYLVIDAIRKEANSLPPATEMERFRHAWAAATRDARHRRRDVVGWYHRHGVLGMRLSEWDLHLQEEFFPHVWQCALIIASTRDGIVGGFIQRSRQARLFRKGLAPFYELVDLDVRPVEGLKPSYVDWANYAASEPVSVIRAEWPSPSVRFKSWKAADHVSEAPLAQPLDRPRPGRKRAGAGVSEQREAEAGAEEEAASEPDDEVPAAPEPEEDAAPAAKAEREPEDSGPRTAPTGEAEEESLDGEWTAAFMEAVWGPSVLEPEESEDVPAAEPSAADAGEPDRRAAAPAAKAGEEAAGVGAEAEAAIDPEEEPAPAASDDASAPDAPREAAVGDEGGSTPSAEERGKAPFELLPPYEPEPPEIPERSSLAWLVTLMGEALSGAARPPRASGQERDGETTDEPPEPIPSATLADAGAGTEPPTVATPDVSEATEESPAAATDPEATDESAAAIGSERGPEGVPSPTAARAPVPVGAEREQATPILLFEEGPRWRPSAQQLRVAAGIAGLIAVSIAIGLVLGPEPPSGPAGIANPRPASAATRNITREFVRLADDYLTDLYRFRARLPRVERGEEGCDPLADDFTSMSESHDLLARYVEREPAMSERFEALDAEMEAARESFAATECAPSLGSEAPSRDPQGSPTPEAGSGP